MFLRRSLLLTSKRFASTLILVEHDHKTINGSTLAAVTAAKKIGGEITCLVAGSGVDPIAQAASKISGVTHVLQADKPQYAHDLAENYAALILKLQAEKKYSHILGTVSYLAKSTLPRVAAVLDVNQISDIVAVENESRFTRLQYAGNAICAVESLDSVKIITIRPSAFAKESSSGGNASVSQLNIDENPNLSEFVSAQVVKSDRPNLTTAKVVFCGGRALKDAETFNKMMYPIADKIGAAVGATRAAVDSGYCSNDLQIGQTGKIIAPDLYVGFGVSGAIQHLTGMKDSKVILVVNKDPDAPLVQIADYALVEDLYKVIPEMEKLL